MISVSRLLHCVNLTAAVELERERDGNDIDKDISFAVYATLVGWENPLDAVQRRGVARLTGIE